MNNNNEKTFRTSEEAFEFLVKRNQDEKRKEAWTKSFGKTSDFEKDHNSKKKNVFLENRYILTSIAAIGIVLVILLNGMRFSLESYSYDFVNSTAITSSYQSNTRGETLTETNPELERWKSEINATLIRKDYGQAIGLFKQFEKNYSLGIEEKFYFAISLLKNKNEDHFKAIALLTDVADAKDTYYQEALWFRALGYGMVGNEINMKIDLENLIELSSYKTKDSKEILKKLN